jgi:hypothetical protein
MSRPGFGSEVERGRKTISRKENTVVSSSTVRYVSTLESRVESLESGDPQTGGFTLQSWALCGRQVD